MMTAELAFTPSGRITVSQAESDGERSREPRDGTADRHLAQVLKAFESSPAEGLFALATQRIDTAWAPSFGYWRDFAARYLSALCETPEGADTRAAEIPPPGPAELASMLLSVPPMQGAEYVSGSNLVDIWRDLDAWVRAQVAASRTGLSGFLKERAPLWHQVGRVCFHLAENRRDPDYPFAFLATYAPRVTGGGRVQYQPLSKALEQYAGAKNKKALIKLLSPVQLASEKSPLVRETGRLGRHLPTAGVDAATSVPVSARMCRCSRKAASWCGCPTGGRNALVPGWALPSATRDKRNSTSRACWTSRCSWPWATRN